MNASVPGTNVNTHGFDHCRNIADGPVILLASGASARDFPLPEFAQVPVIAMNGSIAMLQDNGIDPFFYACTDKDFPRQQPALFADAMRRSQRVALWEEMPRAEHAPPRGEVYWLSKARNLTFLQTLWRKQEPLVRNPNSLDKRTRSIGFSLDLEQGFFDARTVAFLALQLAYHVGFRQVFLVGVDLDQAAGRFYENDDSERSPCGLDQHFETRILPSLKLMADRVVGERFRVYNLSANSRIPGDVIPKIDVQTMRSML